MNDTLFAFPLLDWNGDWKGPDASHGITIMDYFAAKALQGDMAAQNEYSGSFSSKTPDEHLEERAIFYYRFAKAMMKARQSA